MRLYFSANSGVDLGTKERPVGFFPRREDSSGRLPEALGKVNKIEVAWLASAQLHTAPKRDQWWRGYLSLLREVGGWETSTEPQRFPALKPGPSSVLFLAQTLLCIPRMNSETYQYLKEFYEKYFCNTIHLYKYKLTSRFPVGFSDIYIYIFFFN